MGIFFNWTARILVGLLVLLISIWFLIQVPAIQNKLVTFTAEYLSKELNTTVKIDYINIDFFDRVIADGVYVQDLQQDTLFYIKHLKADIGFFSILGGRLDIDELTLDNPTCHLNRQKNKEDFNIQFFIDYFDNADKNKPKGPKGEPFRFMVKKIMINDGNFSTDDAVKGFALRATFDDLNLTSNKWNFEEKNLDLDALYLNGLNLEIEKDFKDSLMIAKLEALTQLSTDTSINVNLTEELDTVKLFASLKKLKIKNSRFAFNDKRKPHREDPRAIDFKHLIVSDINIDIENAVVDDMKVTADVKSISAREHNGFVLEKLKGKTTVGEREITIADLYLKTPQTELRDSFSMKFRSYQDFNHIEDNIYMSANIQKGSYLVFDDIMAFAPELKKNAFFAKNQTETIFLEGSARGKVNSLKGNNLIVQIGQTKFDGDFSSRDLTHRHSEWVFLECRQLQTNIKELSLLVPNFKVKENLTRLGNLSFTGNYTGFLSSTGTFYGKLKSALGEVESDLSLNMTGGSENMTYQGKLNVHNFDLATLLDNKKFGFTSLSGRIDGKGLSLEKLSAKLDQAKVDNFSYNGHVYTDVAIEGLFEKKLFKGSVHSDDPSAKLSFNGLVDLNDTVPKFNLQADVTNFDLKALNISEADYRFAGKILLDAAGNNPDNIKGKAYLDQISAWHEGKVYRLDSLVLSASNDNMGRRRFTLDSDIGKATLSGTVKVMDLPNSFIRFAEDNFPVFAEKLAIKSRRMGYEVRRLITGDTVHIPVLYTPAEQNLVFFIKLDDSKNLCDLLPFPLRQLHNVNAFGYYDSQQGTFSIKATADSFYYDKTHFFQPLVDCKVEKGEMYDTITVQRLQINPKLSIPGVTLSANIINDTLGFNTLVASPFKQLSDIGLSGKLFFREDSLTEITFAPSGIKKSFTVYGRDWTVAEGNYVRFKKGYLDIHELSFYNDRQGLTFTDQGHTGLNIGLKAIDIAWLTTIVRIKPFHFGGEINGNVGVYDVFNLKGLYAYPVLNNVIINNDNWGDLVVNAEAADIKSKIELKSFSLTSKDKGRATGTGFIYPAPMTEKEKDKNTFELNIAASDFSPKVLEYVLGKNVSNVVGKADGVVRFYNTFENPMISAEVQVRDAAATVEMLKVRYYIDKAIITADNTGIHIVNQTLRDEEGNTATVNGSISHRKLNHWGAKNLRIISDGKILALNTTAYDNTTFYGKAYASAMVTFQGEFDKTIDLTVEGTSYPGTQISIPLTGTGEAGKASFIKFVDKKDKKIVVKEPPVSLSGVNLNMTMNITEDAEVKIIFDERAGDLITSHGEGNIRMTYNAATQEFLMYGDYNVVRGNYLFTFQNLVNKPFSIMNGGTIKWAGDPYDAQLNLRALYKGLEVSYYDLIKNILPPINGGDPDAVSLHEYAKKPTSIDLGMKITGALAHPDIDFFIDFPSVDPKIRSYVDNKKRALEDNKTELNRQVFGLIVFKRFLPSGEDSNSGNTNALFAGVNTLSEMLSSQLSMYLGALLDEVVTDVKFIDDININLGFNLTDQTTTQGTTSYGSTFNFSLDPSFIEGRLTFRLGANLDVANDVAATSNQPYIGGDFLLEYKITKDGRFRVKAYARGENSLTAGRSYRTGIGISYRRDFDKVTELFKVFQKKVEQKSTL